MGFDQLQGDIMTARALHLQGDDDSHAVLLDRLRVLVVEQDGHWFAQGVQVDYAADGDSLEDVKRRFETGLCATMGAHIREFGTIEGVLKYAPEEDWKSLKDPTAFSLTSLSFHEFGPDWCEVAERLPFTGIEFIHQQARAA